MDVRWCKQLLLDNASWASPSVCTTLVVIDGRDDRRRTAGL